MQAARSSEKAAQAAIATAKADVAAAAATIEEAKANLKNSEAKVQVAQSVLDKDTVWAGYRSIVSPYTGVVTKRTFHHGRLHSRRRAQRGSPLVGRGTDRSPPRRDRRSRPGRPLGGPRPPRHGPNRRLARRIVPRHHLPHRRLRRSPEPHDARRGRSAQSQRQTSARNVRPGDDRFAHRPQRRGLAGFMSCRAQKEGKGAVYVVRDGKARLVAVKLGSNDGIHVEILDGLAASDEVVCGSKGPWPTAARRGGRGWSVRDPASLPGRWTSFMSEGAPSRDPRPLPPCAAGEGVFAATRSLKSPKTCSPARRGQGSQLTAETTSSLTRLTLLPDKPAGSQYSMESVIRACLKNPAHGHGRSC